MLIKPEQSCLIVVDVQERLVPAVIDADALVARCAVLMRTAAALGLPILVSEQYPRGLGRTVPALAALAPSGAVFEKTHFSCAAEPGFAQRFAELGRPQAVVVGIESHVCVLQTALGLAEAGARPYVVEDAVSSRRASDKAAALARLGAAGIAVATTEMVVFEWLVKAGTPQFKIVQDFIK